MAKGKKKQKKSVDVVEEAMLAAEHGNINLKAVARKASEGALLADAYREKLTHVTQGVMRALYFLTKEGAGEGEASRARNALLHLFGKEELAPDWQDYWLWAPNRPSHQEVLDIVTQAAHAAIQDGANTVAVPSILYRWLYEAICALALPAREPEVASPSTMQFAGCEVITIATLMARQEQEGKAA